MPGLWLSRLTSVASPGTRCCGALAVRVPTKRALVLAALASLAADAPPAPTGDPAEDVLTLLDEIAISIAGPQAGVMSSLLVGPDRELAEALGAAKLAPQLERLRERLRAAVGDVADLETRAELARRSLASVRSCSGAR